MRLPALLVAAMATMAAADTSPRVSVTDGMVLVPAGVFIYGSPTPQMNESAAHEETLAAFYIDRTEVTNAQYKKFVDWMRQSSDHRKCSPDERKNKDHTPRFWGDPKFKAINGATMPVVGVDWYDAVAYAAWAHKRLPTEKEWEKAARGTDGRAYPWGNEWEPTKLNFGDQGAIDGFVTVAPVGSFGAGKSPYGCLDMAGNAVEWCADLYDPENGNTRSIRGGSCLDNKWIRAWTRDFYAPCQVLSRLGFRCVADGK